MHATNSLYGCAYPVSDVLFRNLAKAIASKPLDAYDSIIARSGNKWDALQYAVRVGEPCAFDGTAGNDVRALFADYCAEPV